MTRAEDFPQVASPPARAYLAPVSLRHILSLLLLVGLVLAPLGMFGGSPAMAMSVAEISAQGHSSHAAAVAPCHSKKSVEGNGQAPDSKQLPGNCCVMMCSAIQAVSGQLAEHLEPQQILQPLPPSSRPHGLKPEADPPPPRFS